MGRGAALLAVALLGSGCGSANQRWIHKINFIGVKSQSINEKDLRSKLVIQQTSWFPFASKQYLDVFSMKTDEKRIVAYYNEHGYLNARILATNLKNRGKRSLDLDIKVDEGPATHIDEVSVSGLDTLGDPGKKLLGRLRVKRGDVYNEKNYLDSKAALAADLQERGHAWAEVKGVADINRDARLATLHYTINPGPLVTFGDVRVEGTRVVSPKDVIRQSGIIRGEPYRPVALDDARGKLYNLGLFSSVRPDLVHDPAHPDVADVKITVNETKLRELRLGAGLGFESQRTDVHVVGIYTQRNFFGGLRTLRFSVQPGYTALPAFWNIVDQGPTLIAEGVFTQPDVLWRYAEFKWTVGYDLGIEYGYHYHGPRTQLALRRPLWRDRIHLGLSYNFQYLGFFDVDPNFTNPDPTQRALLGTLDLSLLKGQDYRLGWWQEDFSLDLRDASVDATRGGYLGVTLEEGGVYAGGAFTYEKIVPELRGYLPLGGRVVLAARVLYGKMFVHSDSSPITRRFYLGGPDSHRGFNYNRLSPQLITCVQSAPIHIGGPLGQKPPTTTNTVCRDTLQIPVGGEEMFLGQVEARVNLVRLFGFWLGAATFLDLGDVTNQGIDFTNLNYAVGGGLRYKTIIGTLRFDLGVRLNRLDGPPGGLTENVGKIPTNPDPGDRIAYHISIGEAF